MGTGGGGGLLGGVTPGGAESVGDENRLPTVSETNYRSVGISETDLVFSFCPSFSIPGA
ncbi:hypothetical protein GPL15_23445 [Clostridium sp. MCC353]|uniref:hypothetical protein n=1 Tax=Clostridium sp. MCC353 TaxID=2592646 RepID=UPI001C01CB5C|nr:hypothetical protein [Clostridium sp. MCC353]MBT9779437.1 hypothetical protein [Clostridium sp. MCC353]